MSKELVISAAPHETRVAILEEGQLCEIYIEREKEFALVGSIYKGRVTRVLPGMQSAFVDIGLDGDAFLYVSDFLEHLEEYDHVVSTVETKVEKMEQQGGQVFSPVPLEAPVPTPAAEVESEPPAASQPVERVTLPGETRGAADSQTGQAQIPASSQGYSNQGRPPERRDRDSRGDFGRDQGRGPRGRWGRRGGGGSGGDRRHGRDLPPSKYASSRPYENRPYDRRPSEPRPFEPVPPGAEPIILPGESLAKYTERPAAPASSANLGAGNENPAATHGLETIAPAILPEGQREEAASSLPHSLYVGETSAPAPEQIAREHSIADPDLSEDEAISLAEQLAEAKHEEAQKEAEAQAAAAEAD